MVVLGMPNEIVADCRFFATQNPAKYAGRQSLPATLLSRFVQLHVGDFPRGELSKIIISRADEGQEAAVPPGVAKQMEDLYFQLQKDEGLDFSMRDIIKWLRRHRHLGRSSHWWISGLSLLHPRIQAQPDASRRLIEAFASVDGWSGAASSRPDSIVDVCQHGDNVKMTQGSYSILLEGAQLSSSSLFNNKRCPPQSFLRALLQIAVAAQHREPVLLVGPTSFKSLLVKTWAAITAQKTELMKVHLSADTEVSELVGQIQPTTAVKLLQELPSLAQKFAARIAGSSDYEDPIQRSRKDGLNALITALQSSVEATVADYEERYRSQLSPSLSSSSDMPSDGFGGDEPDEFRPVDISAFELTPQPMRLSQAMPDQLQQPLDEPWQLTHVRSVISKSSSSSSSSSSNEFPNGPPGMGYVHQVSTSATPQANPCHGRWFCFGLQWPFHQALRIGREA